MNGWPHLHGGGHIAYQKWKKNPTTVDQLRVQWLRPVSTAQERCEIEIECDRDNSQDSLQYASLPPGAAKYDTRALKYLMRMCRCQTTHGGARLLAHTPPLCIHGGINLAKVYLSRDACGKWKICTKWQRSRPPSCYSRIL